MAGLRESAVSWLHLFQDQVKGIIAAVAVAGIVAGSMIAHKVKEQTLKTAFGWFVLVLGTTILIEQFRHLYL
ncbi:MAG: hypothetical protein V4596_14035 [Bdellovibrionota bacterium]